MSKKSSVKFDLSALNSLREQISAGTYVKVGVLGEEASRDTEGVNNVELGVIHELGSYTQNIPARSFLLMPLEEKRNEIVKFVGSKKVKDEIVKGDVKRALGMIGVYAEAWIQSAFASRGFGKWAPLSPVTVARKGSTAQLIETGQLRRSITSEVVEA